MLRACSLVTKGSENNFVGPPAPTRSERTVRLRVAGGDQEILTMIHGSRVILLSLSIPPPPGRTPSVAKVSSSIGGALEDLGLCPHVPYGARLGKKETSTFQGHLFDNCLVSSMVKPKWISCLCPGSRSFFRSHWLQPFCIKIPLVFPIVI